MSVLQIAKRIKGYLCNKCVDIKPRRINDVFKSGYEKRALLSYIVHDYYGKEWFDCEGVTHTNILESKAFATELHLKGYSVDVVDYLDRHELKNEKKYDVVCGFGYPFEKMMQNESRPRRVHIFYGTGCHTNFSNRETVKIKLKFLEAYGFWPSLGGREVAHSWPLQMHCSDYYIALGNEFVYNTYIENIVAGKVLRLDAFYLNGGLNSYPLSVKEKSFKKNVLWFGSSGAIHKGLILTLEALREIPGLQLHIVGLVDQERKRLRLEENFADIMNRIHFHGFLHVGSERFFEVMNLCGIISFPSCSEGGSPSVLTACYFGGGIPVIKASCGLSLDSYGVVIPDDSINHIVSAFNKINELPANDHLAKIESIRREIGKQYTLQNYRNNISKIFDSILGGDKVQHV